MKSDFLESCRPYEIYPVSFYDGNGDGIGDIRGIIEKLDYLKSLNINLIWINPFFESPFRDGGYDITDYYKIDSRFGTNEDAAELFKKAEEKGIKIMLDLVVGHTSDKHPWFIESSKAEKNEYSDLYIWNNQEAPFADNKYGNFICGCSERANSYRINYYAHQPALNYGYYKVKEDWQISYKSATALKNQDRVIDIIKFWLKLGANGYRVDMAGEMVKNDVKAKGNTFLWNRIIGKVREEFPEAIFIPEWSNAAQSKGNNGFDMYCLWSGFLIQYDNSLKLGNVYFTKEAKKSLVPFLLFLKAMTNRTKGKSYINLILSCHDCGRLNSGYSDAELKVIHAFSRTMPLITFCYMGEELGIPNREVKSRDGGYSRTMSRTPMQWTNGKNLGFSSAEEIYLPVEENKDTEHTVEKQDADPDSLLNAIREINNIKEKYSCFNVSSKFKVLKLGGMRGYPFVFERKNGLSRGVVVISPESKSNKINLKKYGINGSYNSFYSGGKLNEGIFITEGPSFAIFYK